MGEDNLLALRQRYAADVLEQAGQRDARLYAAFATVPRERFLGTGPWQLFGSAGYSVTPSADPWHVYANVVVALKASALINNGEPSLHASCIGALGIHEGERVVHIGAGSGYYTAILAELVGPTGSVDAIEIDRELADAARCNLAAYPWVTVTCRSGAAGDVPACDAIYVSAGATGIPDVWLARVRQGARLLLPLAPLGRFGAMLLVQGIAQSLHARARFISRAMFIPCIDAVDAQASERLAAAFEQPDVEVRSLVMTNRPGAGCWYFDGTWWLSVDPVPHIAVT